MKNTIQYFDAHSHLHSSFFNEKADGQKVAEEMKKEKIFSVIIGVNFEDSKKAVKMAEKNENLFCSIGVHPADEYKENWQEEKFQKLFDKNKEKTVCVGECGLDYHWPNNDLKSGKISSQDFLDEKRRQKKLFENQIDFAVKNDLPLMLHIRSFENADAHFDAFEILDKKQLEHDVKIRADFHFFTESPEIAREVLKRNFMISLPGVITFAVLDKTVAEIPMENIMSETDSPFAAPKPYRGKTNTPIYVKEVVKKIAEIKNIPEEEVCQQTIKNALEFFDIK